MNLALDAFYALGDRNFDSLAWTLKAFADSASARNYRDVFPQIARFPNEDEYPLLVYAAESFPEAIPLLVQASFDVNIVNKAGATALYRLTDIVHLKAEDAVPAVEAVRALLTAGADPNRRGYLHRVVETSPLEPPVAATMAALLVQHGADFDLLNDYDQNPLDVAFDWCNAPVVRVLMSAGATLSADNTEKTSLHKRTWKC